MELDFLREIFIEDSINTDIPGEAHTNMSPQLAAATANINHDATLDAARQQCLGHHFVYCWTAGSTTQPSAGFEFRHAGDHSGARFLVRWRNLRGSPRPSSAFSDRKADGLAEARSRPIFCASEDQ